MKENRLLLYFVVIGGLMGSAYAGIKHDLLVKQAGEGDHQAQFDLAVSYEQGDGVEVDPVLAARWYGRAAEGGLPEAQFKLGMCLATGSGVVVDIEAAFRWIHSSAQKYYAPAEFMLGKSYEDGLLGLKKDEGKALKWIRRAATQQYPEALFTLGEYYHHGFGVEAEMEKAVDWYTRAADRGSDDARLTLCENFNEWILIAPDKQLIVGYMRAVAESGNLRAQRMLGAYLSENKNVLNLEAYKWLKAASDQGDIVATEMLGRLIMERGKTERDRDDAIRLLTSVAVKTDDADCMMELGSLYANKGQADALSQSAKWFVAAAKQGKVEAQVKCVILYGKGIGVPQSRIEALAWALVADSHGKSAYKLNMEPIMSIEEKTKAHARCRALLMEMRKQRSVAE